MDIEYIGAQDIVQSVKRVQEPYKKANRKFHPDDTVIDLGHGSAIGGGKLGIIAGPCSVESEEQILSVASDVKASGAAFLRGGAFKPRTSPYAFQGCAPRASSCCGMPASTPACRSSPKSCRPATWRFLWQK